MALSQASFQHAVREVRFDEPDETAWADAQCETAPADIGSAPEPASAEPQAVPAPAADPAPDAEPVPVRLLYALPPSPFQALAGRPMPWRGEPPEPGMLQRLAPAEVQATATPAVAATPMAVPAPAAAAASATYVGEPAVDAAWLQQRETALSTVRRDYEAALAQARQQPGTGPGWVDAVMSTDESGRSFAAAGAPTVFVPTPDAAPQVVGWDEGGPLYGPPPGCTLEFSEAAFAAHYRAQAGAPLQTLAASYDTDASTLLAQHPELWSIATQDHALNAGPAPVGRAMGGAAQLGMVDLYMADPQMVALIDAFGGQPEPPTSALAQEQARLYGPARYEQLTRLSTAMQAVRDGYASALQAAQRSGQGPGWSENQRSVTVSDESGATRTELQWLSDEGGQRTPLMERVFDVDVFTDGYTRQDGLKNQAFGDFYGASHTSYASDESGARVISQVRFDNPGWSIDGGAGYGTGATLGAMRHDALVRLDPNHAPRLNDANAVGFDFDVGWATHQSNIHQKRDWFETVVQVAIVAVAAWATGGAAATWAAGAGYGAGATAAIAGAAAGASASAVSGAMNGNLSFKGVLQGALSGALTGGLMQGAVGQAVQGAVGTAGTVLLRGTVQGGINALLGGSFKDGAIAGIASGLAEMSQANLQAGIDEAVARGTMSAAEAITARTMARVFSSAVRTLGSPDDPQYGFATSLVGDLVNDGLAMVPDDASIAFGPALDDDGNPMPGVIDPAAPLSAQIEQLTARLQAQGMSLDDARRVAYATLLPPSDPFTTISDTDLPSFADDIAALTGLPRGDLIDVGLSNDLGRYGDVLLGYVEGLGISGLTSLDALIEIAKSPRQFVNGVKALITSPEARTALGETIARQVEFDLGELQGALDRGDMRLAGQQVGKLTGDLVQVAGGVEALARLGVSTASAGGRLVLGAADDLALSALKRDASLFNAQGEALMDFRALSTAQKQFVGETLGADTVGRLLPDAQRIGRVPTVGQHGIDDLYRVNRPDVDYVVVEYKFGSGSLGSTRDGLQMSDTWLTGGNTGYDRILQSVSGNRVLADTVSDALVSGRVERWVVHTDPLGNVTVGMVDASGRVVPKPVSQLLRP